MKKLYFTLLAALLFSFSSFSADTVYVHGYVFDLTGAAAPNVQVNISPDSILSPNCHGYYYTYTNQNGYYNDTIYCNSSIAAVNVAVMSCNGSGNWAVINRQVPPTKIVEANFPFTVCPPQQTCQAYFTYSVQQMSVAFMSNSSASGGGALSFMWNFGDGASSTIQNPIHTYAAGGTYTVKLVITSATGCRDSISKPVTVTNPSVTCHAQFRDSLVAPNKYYFFSGGSTASTGSTITQRIWSFGDGTYNTANNENVDHLYQQSGTYYVCLRIVTSGGCVDSTCKTITVNIPPPATCHANFGFQTGANGVVYFTNTSSTLGTTTQYYWFFGSNAAYSTAINPTYTFAPGTYNVCLRIFTSNCADSICKTITIAPPPPPTNCEAAWSFTGLQANPGTNGYSIQFGSPNSHATSAVGDSIRERIWVWGDGSSTTGNNVYPTHTYTAPGTYNVCLVIRSASGCSDTTCKSIAVPMPNQLVCKSQFTYENLPVTTTTHREVRFNSTTSAATGSGDSIISRKWTFGDGTTLTSNNAIISHVYNQPGTYTVCLTIKTALGCEKTECKSVIVTQVTSACVPHFTWVRTASKQVSFNSSTSWVPLNDTIIERKWNFGDATPLLAGNMVSPVHNYLNNGVYTVSLKIRTNHNCEQTFTMPVNVQDSTLTPPTVEPIKIISIYPNPATIQTQTVVWSQFNNVQAELAIYDVYGIKKWSITKILLQGNNITVIPTALLMPGPYYFRVTTSYGVKSRPFFKRN